MTTTTTPCQHPDAVTTPPATVGASAVTYCPACCRYLTDLDRSMVRVGPAMDRSGGCRDDR